MAPVDLPQQASLGVCSSPWLLGLRDVALSVALRPPRARGLHLALVCLAHSLHIGAAWNLILGPLLLL